MYLVPLFAFLALPAWLLAVPIGVWITVAGIVSAGGVALWWRTSKASPAVKVRQLRFAADVVERLAIVPLRMIAPSTPTQADDKALRYLEELVRTMRAAADSSSGIRALVPSPAAVSESVVVRMAAPPQVVRLQEPAARG